MRRRFPVWGMRSVDRIGFQDEVCRINRKGPRKQGTSKLTNTALLDGLSPGTVNIAAMWDKANLNVYSTHHSSHILLLGTLQPCGPGADIQRNRLAIEDPVYEFQDPNTGTWLVSPDLILTSPPE